MTTTKRPVGRPRKEGPDRRDFPTNFSLTAEEFAAMDTLADQLMAEHGVRMGRSQVVGWALLQAVKGGKKPPRKRKTT